MSDGNGCEQCRPGGRPGWIAAADDAGHDRLRRCDCHWRQAEDRILRESGIPARFRDAAIDGIIDYGNAGLDAAIAKVQAFAANFPIVDRGLLLIGPPGIGKTHLAIGAVTSIVRRTRATAIYRATRALLRSLRSAIAAPARVDHLQPVLDAEILILDDLGAERLTDYVADVLDDVIDTRYNHERATIFTTNYENDPDPESLDSLQTRVGQRTYSRLCEMCDVVEFRGTDVRKLRLELERPPTADEMRAAWRSEPARRGAARARRGAPRGKPDLKW